jgi:hypothetical protein
MTARAPWPAVRSVLCVPKLATRESTVVGSEVRSRLNSTLAVEGFSKPLFKWAQTISKPLVQWASQMSRYPAR